MKKKNIKIDSARASPTDKETITMALLQKALGYEANEVVEEYSCDEQSGELKMCKKKITTKQFPPDLDAAQSLLELLDFQNQKIQELSDSELEQEKQRLLEELKNIHGDKNEN